MKPARNKGPVGFDKNVKISKKTIKRLLGYLFTPYKLQIITVFICLIVSAITGVAGSLFLKTVIDDYIEPLLLESAPVFTGLFNAIMIMGAIYLLGILSTFIYTRVMAVVSQKVLKQIRDEMFEHMQKLPIKYFDTHSHGDVMSIYTNDTDTLRQMISQSIPQVFSSIINKG